MFSSLHSTTQQQLDCSPSQCSTRRHHHHHQEERKHMEKKNEEKESLDIHKVPKRKSPEHSETERVLKQVKIVPNEKAGELGFHRSSNNKDCTTRRMCNHPPHVFQPFCQQVRLLSHLHSTSLHRYNCSGIIALSNLQHLSLSLSLSLYSPNPASKIPQEENLPVRNESIAKRKEQTCSWGCFEVCSNVRNVPSPWCAIEIFLPHRY